MQCVQFDALPVIRLDSENVLGSVCIAIMSAILFRAPSYWRSALMMSERASMLRVN